MNEIQIYNNKLFGEIRTITIDNDPWFVAKDVADILGYSDTQAMTRRLDNDEIMTDKLSGMNMKSTLINESGLYSSIIGSKKPEAKQFKKWVTAEVLPSIRKHGMYMTTESIEKALINPDFMIQVLTTLKEERLENNVLKQQIAEQEPKVTYYDLVLNSPTLITITAIAKDYGMSAIALNTLLHDLNIQYKMGGTWFLYSHLQDKGYTQSTTHLVDNYHTKMNTKWTQKGRLFLYEQLKGIDVLPMIEREEQ